MDIKIGDILYWHKDETCGCSLLLRVTGTRDNWLNALYSIETIVLDGSCEHGLFPGNTREHTGDQISLAVDSTVLEDNQKFWHLWI